MRIRIENAPRRVCDKLFAAIGSGPAPVFRVATLVTVMLCASPIVAQTEEPYQRLPRTNLMVWRDAHGGIAPVKSRRDWLKRRAEILRSMQEVMGPLPGAEKRVAPDWRLEEEVDCGTYVRRSISYASEPGARTPAYLLIPKEALGGRKKFPAVLCLHSTDIQLGNKVAVGLGGKPNRDYAAELARRGYVTLAPAYPLMGGYLPDLRALGYESATMKAVWDNMRGVDLLESLPFVQKGGVGVIGHSLGGHNAIFTAVFDDRIKVVVSSCGFDSFAGYMDGNLQGWSSRFYMPRLLDYPMEGIPFDFHELIGALAPRRVFVNAPLQDGNFKWRSVAEIMRAAAPVYRLHGASGNIRVEHPDSGHDFPPEIRDKAYKWIEDTLR